MPSTQSSLEVIKRSAFALILTNAAFLCDLQLRVLFRNHAPVADDPVHFDVSVGQLSSNMGASCWPPPSVWTPSQVYVRELRRSAGVSHGLALHFCPVLEHRVQWALHEDSEHLLVHSTQRWNERLGSRD